MALIADKKTSKNLENRIDEFSKFGMTFYYLFEEGRISMLELENLFFSKDNDKSSFAYMNILRRIKQSDIDSSLSKYKSIYPNEKLLDKTVYEANLNILYIKNLINTVLSTSKDRLDKVYINTYNYLLSRW